MPGDIIKKYKQVKCLDFNMKILMNSIGKEEFDKLAKYFNVSTSDLNTLRGFISPKITLKKSIRKQLKDLKNGISYHNYLIKLKI